MVQDENKSEIIFALIADDRTPIDQSCSRRQTVSLKKKLADKRGKNESIKKSF